MKINWKSKQTREVLLLIALCLVGFFSFCVRGPFRADSVVLVEYALVLGVPMVLAGGIFSSCRDNQKIRVATLVVLLLLEVFLLWHPDRIGSFITRLHRDIGRYTADLFLIGCPIGLFLLKRSSKWERWKYLVVLLILPILCLYVYLIVPFLAVGSLRD